MKIRHWVKRENSGLFHTMAELAAGEEKAGHGVSIRQPNGEAPLYGPPDFDPDVELIHSQFNIDQYQNGKPAIMWMHGEPLSSVGNKVSMKAIVDLAPLMDAFICMRREEHIVWNSIKRTYLVPKGIDLDLYKPLGIEAQRLEGEPAILYCENWRGQRNPLYLCLAMQEVIKKYPKARLHLVNCNDKKMMATFKALINNNKWWRFIKTLAPGVPSNQMNLLYNRADIVVSCLYPLYARSIEAFGAGKAFIGPGYNEPGYPWTCDLQPESIAEAIVKCWENYDRVDYRKWAESRHDVAETVRQSVGVYERYL